MSDVWVINASPLILLDKINRLDLCNGIVCKIFVPETVFHEVQTGLDLMPRDCGLLDWTASRQVTDVPIPLSVERWDLGRGESQVIAHSLVEKAYAVLDDAQGRACAMAHSIPVIGTLGIVLRAKRRGLIPAVWPILQELRLSGMYLSDHIVREILMLSGEYDQDSEGKTEK